MGPEWLCLCDGMWQLNWRGLYVNEGEALQRLHCPHTRRRLVLEHVVPLIRRCKEALAHKQLTPEMVTGGGTGTLHAHVSRHTHCMYKGGKGCG